MRRIFLKLFIVLYLLPCSTHAKEAAQIEIETNLKAEVVKVKVQAVIEATPQIVWATLIDYERFSEFIPGMKSSKVIERKGPIVTIKQSGHAQMLFFHIPIEVTVESTEDWPVLRVKRISGTIRQLEGRYEMIPSSDNATVRLVWTGSIQPENSFPPFIGESLIRYSLRQQFTGMVREIERRATK
jgi:ribosome-associated toxin RatA of RatAB toxin-antitoxin module